MLYSKGAPSIFKPPRLYCRERVLRVGKSCFRNTSNGIAIQELPRPTLRNLKNIKQTVHVTKCPPPCSPPANPPNGSCYKAPPFFLPSRHSLPVLPRPTLRNLENIKQTVPKTGAIQISSFETVPKKGASQPRGVCGWCSGERRRHFVGEPRGVWLVFR